MMAIATAEQLLAQGRSEEADRASLEILAREPANPRALLVHAVASTRLRRLEEAERAAHALLQAGRREAPARYLIANVAFIAGDEARALSTLAQAIATDFGTPGVSDPWTALRLAVDVIAREPTATWGERKAPLLRFGSLLARCQPEPAADVLEALVASPLLDVSPVEFPPRFTAVVDALGFAMKSPPAWNRRLVDALLLPWMRRALARDRFDIALEIELTIYVYHVKQVETEAHFHDMFELWKDELRAAGARFAARLPKVARGRGGKLPRVGFFVHNVMALAHVQSLLETLEGHASLPAPMIEPYLFFETGNAETIARFRATGTRIEPLAPPGTSCPTSEALVRLRSRLAAEGIDTLVWTSVAVGMPFAFAMRLARRQVWWAMKYHALELPEIDGHVTGGSQTGGTKVIHGREWRVGPVAAAQWFAPELAGEAKAARAALGLGGTLYGTFGRDEKLTDPAYLDAVIAILRAQPDAGFLWTGRLQRPEIQQRFEAAGVAARCRFIGWVNTKVYAQVIDVFLDSFPFPCGFTLYEAMAAGKPVVLYAGPGSDNTGINALVEPLLRAPPEASAAARAAHDIFRPEPGVDLYLRRADPASYVEAAVRLGNDAAFRQRAGEAARAFVERLMTDRAGAARVIVNHLLGRDTPA